MKAAIVLFAALATYVAVHNGVARTAADVLWSSTTGRIFILVGGAYGSAVTIFSFWRLALALRYKPVPNVADSRLPKLTVVVPSYNEGKLVYETLRNIALSHYPRERLEIFVIDDGSVDDTWQYIRRAVRDFGPRIHAQRLPENRGKRHALYEGFRRGTGDVFITVDSDSLIARDALRSVVSPMVVDPSVGAVAGNVRVLNRRGGIIPRMLAVRYVMTFDYKRASQSMMGGGGVLCCAGALAAYRRSAVMPILDQWLNQTWRGSPARAGEDHAMTNFILRQGLKVKFQRTAQVLTNSPTTYRGLCKMFTRWARSNVRESFHSGEYFFTNFRPESKIGMRFNFIMSALGQFLPYVYLLTILALSVAMPTIFGIKLVASCAAGSLFTVLFFGIRERSSEALMGVLYGMFATFGLFWVHPWALLTCDRSVWLTRNKKAITTPTSETLNVPPQLVTA
ncbi:MAG TPA: glycosyltransferase [Phycisphaerae bacterium]|nr:glycosyltransferase [Phycisphaerae bacterium]HRW54186.1 glycosyltransferase [Phycisphaerae bacterium]